MSDLQSSSEHRKRGLLSPNRRAVELRRILSEMTFPEETGRPIKRIEVEAMQDLCYRLYSAEVSDLMANLLSVSRQEIREALDTGVKWKA